METNKLIIFVKNPVLGKVKTRLAVEVGNDSALETYKMLLQHTYKVVSNCDASVSVYYADFINDNDLWNSFDKQLQVQEGLGSRMYHAVKNEFDKNFKKVVIIGSDCLDISSKIIMDAFDVLDENDVVLGPAQDGGYYLLGSKKIIPEVFKNKKWSTESVFIDTIEDINKLKLNHFCLETLYDIDTKADLERYEIIKSK
jgi:rSAM/selenodomain-associated transferase 1